MITRRPAVRSEHLVYALTVVALLPVWIFRFFPTQDGPNHVYNAFVLAHLGDAGSTMLRRFFVINAQPFPNWTTYLVMAPLMRVLPPTIVQQIVLSMCVAGMPLSVLYLQKAFKAEADPLALLGVLLAYNYLLFLGFFNFVAASALFAISIGFWWRRRDGRYLLPLYALLALTYFTHGLPFTAAAGAIALLAILEKRWRVLVELIPAFAAVAYDAAGRIGAHRQFRGVVWHMRNFTDLRPFVYFNITHVWIARAALVAVALAIAFTRTRHRVALVSLALVAGYFVMPWGYGPEGWELGGWINDRLLFLAMLTLPAWVEVPRARVATAIALSIIAVHFAATVLDVAKLNRQIASAVRAASFVRPHSTLQTVHESEDPPRFTNPTLHAVSYLALHEDVVNLDDYEARLRDFPVIYKQATAADTPPDYVLVWQNAHIRNVHGYGVLFATNEIRLFARAGL